MHDTLINIIFGSISLLCILTIYLLGDIFKSNSKSSRTQVQTKWYNSLQLTLTKHPFRLVVVGFYLVVVVLFMYYNFHAGKSIEFGDLIRISTVLLTIFIGYLFAKLFQNRREKIEIQKTIRAYSKQLTGFRRVVNYLLQSNDFWITYDEISSAKYRHPQVGFQELEIGTENNYDRYKAFLEDKSFNSTRVIIYYNMEEIIKQKYVGWKHDKSSEVKYPRHILEWIEHPINQLYYYFDYKYQKHTKLLFDFDSLKHSYYFNEIIEEIESIFPSYTGLKTITHKTIGELSSKVLTEVVQKMTEITKYDSEYVSSNMRLIVTMMKIMLVTGLLIPLVSQFISDSLYLHILGAISFGIVGSVVLWLTFEIKGIVLDELNTE